MNVVGIGRNLGRAVAGAFAVAACLLPHEAHAGWDTYIAADGSSSGELHVVDSETGGPAGSLASLDPRPVSVAVTPGGERIFTVHFELFGAGSVGVYDNAGNALTDPIEVGNFPYGIAISPDGEQALVANAGSDSVTAIDTETYEVETVSVGDFPQRVAYSPDGTRAFVASLDESQIAVLNPETLEVVDEIETGLERDSDLDVVTGLAVTPDGERLVVSGAGSKEVRIIDIETQDTTVVSLLGYVGRPWWVGVMPDGKRAIALIQDRPDFFSGVVVIDLERAEVETTHSFGGLWNDPALTPDGRRLFVAGAFDPDLVAYYDVEANEFHDLVSIDSASAVGVAPNQAPVPDLQVPLTATAGVPVEFDASGSTDDNGIAEYEFDFGDGSSADGSAAANEHTYEEPGTYEVSVTVDDAAGCEGFTYTGQVAACNGPSRVTSDPVTITIEEPLRLGLEVGLERPQSSLRRVELSTTCKRVDCDARAFGRVRVKRAGAKPKSFKLNPDKRPLTADEPMAMAPTLPAAARRAARKALRRGGKVRAKVRVIARGPGDQRRVRVRQVRIVG